MSFALSGGSAAWVERARTTGSKNAGIVLRFISSVRVVRLNYAAGGIKIKFHEASTGDRDESARVSGRLDWGGGNGLGAARAGGRRKAAGGDPTRRADHRHSPAHTLPRPTRRAATL